MARSVIGVANLKGGVGKTTSSVYLAASAVNAGYAPVHLVDADPQASATEWLETSPVVGVELVSAPTVRRVMDALESLRAGIIVVDTPPGIGDEKIVRAVLDHVSAVVVPTRIGGTEASRVRATLEIVPRRVRRGLVIAAARSGTRGLVESLKTWNELGEQIWGTIPERVAIAEGNSGPLSVIGLVSYRGVLFHALNAS